MVISEGMMILVNEAECVCDASDYNALVRAIARIEQERDDARAERDRLTTALREADAGCIATYGRCRRALDALPVRPASPDDDLGPEVER